MRTMRNAVSLACEVFLLAALLGAACAAQSSSQGADQRRASGMRTITGCLQRQDSGYVIKSEEGTYELNTDRDLSAYVGKQVKISSEWHATGTFTTAPVGGASNAPAPAAPSAQTGAATPAFVGDLNLHITGTVIGDCIAPK